MSKTLGRTEISLKAKNFVKFGKYWLRNLKINPEFLLQNA